MLVNISNRFTTANGNVHITVILCPSLDCKTFNGGSFTLNTNVRNQATLYRLGKENRLLYAEQGTVVL